MAPRSLSLLLNPYSASWAIYKKNPDVDWTLLLSISAIAVAGIFLRSYLSRFVAEDKLKKGFGWFVLITGSGILIKQLS